MTEDELVAIEKRGRSDYQYQSVKPDYAALITEVRRLREELAAWELGPAVCGLHSLTPPDTAGIQRCMRCGYMLVPGAANVGPY